jgi:HSP20 family molecular chaperone IbpA
MQTLRQKPWLVAVATLVIGVAIGLGVSTVTSRSGHASAAANTAAATSHDSTKSDVLDPFSEMERMQADIDRAIRRATDSFRLAPGSDLLRRDLGFSSALDVRDRKDHFEISAYLPDTEASDVKVVTESDKTLRVTVSQKKEEKRDTANGRSSFSELGQYEQLVTLPEPIRSKDMKVERNGHEIVINVPKAKAS